MTDAPRAREWIDQCQNLISRRGHRIAFRRRGQGPVVLLLHGFPTWSYDYAVVAHDLARDHDVITLDFLGYGASDKPNPYEYSVSESADTVEDLAAHLHLDSLRLVAHDYGGIVAQELLDRALAGRLGFIIDSLVMLNSGVVYSAYRPTRMQKLLILPVSASFLPAGSARVVYAPRSTPSSGRSSPTPSSTTSGTAYRFMTATSLRICSSATTPNALPITLGGRRLWLTGTVHCVWCGGSRIPCRDATSSRRRPRSCRAPR